VRTVYIVYPQSEWLTAEEGFKAFGEARAVGETWVFRERGALVVASTAPPKLAEKAITYIQAPLVRSTIRRRSLRSTTRGASDIVVVQKGQ